METYREQKKRHMDEFDKFDGIFFAFNNEQFKYGMLKIGLGVEDTSKIASLGAGGYILKNKIKEFDILIDRQTRERENRLKEKKNLIESLVYELENHEYNITYDPTDALNALGINERDIDPEILHKATQKALA